MGEIKFHENAVVTLVLPLNTCTLLNPRYQRSRLLLSNKVNSHASFSGISFPSVSHPLLWLDISPLLYVRLHRHCLRFHLGELYHLNHSFLSLRIQPHSQHLAVRASRYLLLERVHNISRETALKPSESKSEDRIPLTITYHPNNLRVKDIILKNFKLLQSDPDTATIFEKPPLVSFKRDKSLRNSLVKGSLSTELEPGTFKCVTHVRSSQTPFQFPAQRTPPKSPIISTALPAMSSTAYGAPPVTSFTSAKQDEGWEIVSANIFWM